MDILKRDVEKIGNAARLVLNIRGVMKAYQEYEAADEEHKQEAFDNTMREASGLLGPQAKAFVVGTELVANGIVRVWKQIRQ